METLETILETAAAEIDSTRKVIGKLISDSESQGIEWPELESPLSLPSWFYEEEPETELCPNCEGTGSVAHRCTCGTLPSNHAYNRCESCYRQVDWRSCPECGGKGVLTIK